MEGIVGLIQSYGPKNCFSLCRETRECVGYVYDGYGIPGVCVLKNQVCPGRKSTGFYATMTSGVLFERLRGNIFHILYILLKLE